MKRHRRIKRIARVLLSPLLLFIALILLVYFPPVQHFLCEKAVVYASRTSGMEVSIRRVDLRFPFNFVARDVKMVQAADTLFTLDRVNARVRMLPLLHGKIEIQGVTLQGVTFHLADQVAGMQLTGYAGRFYIRNNKLNLPDKTALISRTELSNAQLRLVLSDEFFEETDTTLDWRLVFGPVKLKNVAFDIHLPDDSLRLAAHVQTARATRAEIDFGKQMYSLNSLELAASSVNQQPAQVKMELDSLVSLKEEVRAAVRLSTPYSHTALEAQIPLDVGGKTANHPITIRLDASIGKEDVMQFASGLSGSFQSLYPNHPLLIQTLVTGNADTVRISRLRAELPTAFALTGGGELCNPLNDSTRSGEIHWQMKTGELGFLAGLAPDRSLTIPPNLILAVKAAISATQYDAALRMKDGQGSVNLNAGYNTTTEKYYANLNIDALRIDRFLPEESLHTLTATLTAKGEKTDWTSSRAWASLHASIKELQYGKLQFSDIDLEAQTNPDSISAFLTAGDMNLRFRSRNSPQQLIEKSANSAAILSKQIKAKALDHKELRQALPSARLTIRAGRNNPLYPLLEAYKISYHNLAVGFVVTPERGINGRASIDALKIDTLQLDTISLAIRQDTARLSIRAGIANNKDNPHLAFQSFITGEVRSNDAELTLEYKNQKGETGILLGVNMRPRQRAMQLTFIPEEPVVAFRKFHFSEHNRVFIRENLHVTANVEMLDKDGMGVRIHSLRDTTALQNLDIEIRKLRLAELSNLPYFPQLTGELSAEANYKQTPDFKQIAVEATIKGLTYEKLSVGDVGFGLTWLPNDTAAHYLNAYLSYDKEEVLTANGTYRTGEQEQIDATATLEHFPLPIINALIPDGMATLSGDIDGEVHVTGTLAGPSINGQIILDDVSVNTHQYGANFHFDNRAVQIKDNRLEFDNFAIYTTTTTNPFTIKGSVNFQHISRPRADLTMYANNYTLLNAPRTPQSLLYGKVFVDVNATIKGPLQALLLRGNMNVRGNTDATYVLADSPLSVQDRLGDLVTFTSFADTLSHGKEEVQPVSLRGLDLLMTIHIDQAVRLKADLSADRKSRLELEGGGDLSFQYTSQGNKTLSGRYTLRKGQIKYALPVIPLKEFTIENGSYVEWVGPITNPNLALKATQRVRTPVMREDGRSRIVPFEASIEIRNKLEDMTLNFDLAAPDDATIQNQLIVMTPEERNKQAVALLVTGAYLGEGNSGKNPLGTSNALNNVLQNQISSLAGSAWKGADIRLGMNNYDDTSGSHTDYNFQYTQRLFNDRIQVLIGGRISTDGDNTADQTESFIDNASLEYRLHPQGASYLRLYHNRNFRSLLEGEITETGAGIVLRKKVNRPEQLFLFWKKEQK